MRIKLHHSGQVAKGKITITGSKSESNRLLILQALYPQIKIKNGSNSDDSSVIQEALKSNDQRIDIHHAGTAMRFLTAYFATQQDRETVLTGSKRMQERPIKLLVDALNSLGADISYEKVTGFPPLKIRGKQLIENKVSLPGNISSQYISALMLIAPSLKNGLEIVLTEEITSLPYITMTQGILDDMGFNTSFTGNKISIRSGIMTNPQEWTVESDWSSASYFYSIVALVVEGEIDLSYYALESRQGDAALEKIYHNLGVETTFDGVKIKLSKIKNFVTPDHLALNLKNTPDLAQTIAVSCLGLGTDCLLTGLHTLKIKETDRLTALKVEMEKLGAKVKITDNSLMLTHTKTLKSDVAIATYNDHRMAMAFAPLGLKVPIVINDAEVVSKSYPRFWDDLQTIGFNRDLF